MKRALIDTNVLVYFLDSSSKYHLWSRQLLYSKSTRFFTTSKNISELLCFLSSNKQESYDIEEALLLVNTISRVFEVLYPSLESSQKCYEICRQVKEKGSKKFGLRIHDIEIAAIGLVNRINHIVTVNVRDFKDIPDVDLISFEGSL